MEGGFRVAGAAVPDSANERPGLDGNHHCQLPEHAAKRLYGQQGAEGAEEGGLGGSAFHQGQLVSGKGQRNHGLCLQKVRN